MRALRSKWLVVIGAVVLLAWAECAAAAMAEATETTDERAVQDALWTGGLKQMYFSDRTIVEGDDVIALDAPARADNAAFVPVAIHAALPQTPARNIRTIWLVIDKNPGPLAGTFHFTPRNGRADLDLRIRINEYTPVRAIAETNDGVLHMSRRYVKASGGCSAPASGDLDAALARLGQIKIRTAPDATAGSPTAVHLLVSHPNLNGLQMDQVTGLYTPARFVKEVRVDYDGGAIFSAETSFAISENPSFDFYFVPDKDGELRAEVVDTNDQHFVHAQRLSLAGGRSQP